jgi:hypothetical protein
VENTTPLAGDPIGVIGTRSTTTAGGHITLLFDIGAGLTPEGGLCNGKAMCLETQLVTVGGEGVPSLGAMLERGVYQGSPAFGSFGASAGTPADYIGFLPDPPAGNPPGILQAYSALTGLAIGSPLRFSTNDPFLRPIAFADCLGQALLIGTNTETAVTSLPVTTAGGVGDRGVMQHSGQSVHFEPFTSTVLAPFTQGEGYELTAFKLGGATPSSLTLRQAPEWTPPAGLRPEIVATRIPVPFKCP